MKSLLSFILLFLSISIFSQKILFVGNSLTYSNDLPKILEFIAKKSGKQIETKSLCYPNYAIIDHLNEGKIQQILKNERFDYVVVQQGPSSQTEGKQMLIEDGAKLKKLCNLYNIQLVYFMVWTSKRWYHTFDLVIKNHTLAAQKNKALLFPVGTLWKKYNTLPHLENLYAQDGFHPSKTGSFFAALVMFTKLYPDVDIKSLKHKNYQDWVTDKESFVRMVSLASLKNE